MCPKFTKSITITTLSILVAAIASKQLPAQQLHIYLANDNHTDYFWSGTPETFTNVALNEIDYYLDLADATDGLAASYQSRYNLDGAWYAYTYKNNRTPAQFDRLIDRIRSGHISLPYNFFASTYGGQPTEAILRGMYWPAKIEREYDIDIQLAVSMENQVLPLGLSSLWAGSGAEYSWKGVCGCSSPVSGSALRDRNHEIYRYQGLDSSEVIMKWYSLTSNTRLGGYAESRNPTTSISLCETKSNTSTYPYSITGAFGHGWDDLQTLTDIFVQTAQDQSDDQRQVYVSNEHDFFEHFAAEYDIGSLPVESVTYGNDWDTDCEALSSVTSQVRRSVEKLRTAEAIASVISSVDKSFYPATDSVREAAWIALGSFWEHNYGLGGCCSAGRGDWQVGLEGDISTYVNGLYDTALTRLSNQIANPTEESRFMVFNALGWPRTDYADVNYSGSPVIRVVDLLTGQEVPHQILDEGNTQKVRILAQDVPAVGYKVFEIRQEASGETSNAAGLDGNVFENDYYRLTVTPAGAVTSLVDKKNGNIELITETDGRYLNDFGQGLSNDGVLSLVHNGPVSAKIACTSDLPLQHTTYFTLYADIDRIDIYNEISDDFGDQIRTYSFSFDFSDPTVWHEELGAILKAKHISNDGHYAEANQAVRYDWQSLNHFADVGSTDYGITLSNLGAGFMKLGNSSGEFLDESSAQLNVLIGGRMGGSGPGFSNQFDLTDFRHSFALRSRSSAFNATGSMKFALEHQTPPVSALIPTQDGSLPDTSFSLLGVSAPDVLLWALKPAEEGVEEGGIIARVWNLSQEDQENTFSFAGSVLDAKKTTHLETDLEPAVVENGKLVATIGQQRMETFRVFLDTIVTNCTSQSTIEMTICQGESFEGYTQAGTFTDVFTAQNGCDSTRILELTVLDNITTTLSAQICQGETFEGYTQTGSYTDAFTAQNGCDSTRILELTVLDNITTTLSAQICQGETFEGYTQTGTYTDNFTAQNGCDSTRILELTVLDNITTTLSAQICQGETFEGYTQTGSYNDTFTAQNGCDSTRTLELTVLDKPSSSLSMEICQGETFEGYTQTGTYTDTFTAQNGCDSTRTLELTVLDKPSSSLSMEICQGETFEGYTQTGSYTDTFTAQNGCDSTRTLELTVLDSTSSSLSMEICQGETFEGYAQTGSYTDTFTAQNGCDSTRTLELTVLDNPSSLLSMEICQGETFEGYTQTGTYTDTFTAQNGCDSTRTLELTVLDNPSSSLSIQICQGEIFEGYTQTGSYTDTFTDQNGCDSTRTLELTVLDNPSSSLSIQICQGETFEGYTQTGSYTDTFTDQNGCDSTRTLELTVLDNPSSSLSIQICQGETFEGYAQTGSYTDTFTAQNGCDSTRTLELTVLDNPSSLLSMEICQGETFEGYTQTGTYTDTFTAQNGCDSTRTLELTVLDNPSSSLSIQICQGEIFEGYTQTGSYNDTFTAQNGCDSTRTLELTVLDKPSSSLSMEICQGETFEGYTQTGTYTDTFTAQNGCDSTRTLELTVLDKPSSSLSMEICQGETFEGYAQTGFYADTFTAQNGCDSTRILELVVRPTFRDTVIQYTCDSTTANTEVDSLTNQFGCDSIIITAVVFIPITYDVITSDVSCFGFNDGEVSIESVAEYMINWDTGSNSTKIGELGPGDYAVTLTDSNTGCSVVDTVSITAPDTLLANLTFQATSSDGASDGTASVMPSGGTPPYTVLWSNGQEGLSIDNLPAGEYGVVVSDANSCIDSTTFVIDIMTGSSAISALEQFDLYPNPVNDQFYLALRFRERSRGTIVLQDYLGKQLYEQAFEGSEFNGWISVESLPAGVYQVQIRVGYTLDAKPIIVEK